jgi:hypothetical protein
MALKRHLMTVNVDYMVVKLDYMTVKYKFMTVRRTLMTVNTLPTPEKLWLADPAA